MTAGKTLYLANPYGFSLQQREGPLAALVVALETLGAEIWEPFARNNQLDRQRADRIGQAVSAMSGTLLRPPAGPTASDRPISAMSGTPTGSSRW